MCVRPITTHKGSVKFQPCSTSLGLKRGYLGVLGLWFILRITVRSKSVCFFLLWWVFSVAIIDLAGTKELLRDLFASHALTLFVFWSGLPLASNGLPSTHKSLWYTSFDPSTPFPHYVLLSVPCLFIWSYFLSQKAVKRYRPSFSCSWKTLL